MTIYSDSFTTTVGKSYITKDIVSGIKEAIIKDNIDKNNLGLDHNKDVYPLFILGNRTSESQIPLFDHPILVDYNGKRYICTDIRPQLKGLESDVSYDAENIKRLIVNKAEYDFHVLRTVLSLQWISEGTNPARMNFHFAGCIFNSMIGQNLARLFGLNPREQSEVSIAADAFYQSLFFEDYTDDLKAKMISHTVKTTKLPFDLVEETYARIKPMTDIHSFCSQLEDVVGNIRFKGFNFDKLLTSIANIWFARNSKRIIPVALEHPPTWIAMCWACLNDRSFKTSMLTKTAENAGKRFRGSIEEFNMNVKRTVDDFSIRSSLLASMESYINNLPYIQVGDFE